MRVVARSAMPSIREATCRCALRVKTVATQLDAAWDVLARGPAVFGPQYARDALTFVDGADSALDPVRTDCNLNIDVLRDRLNHVREQLQGEDPHAASGMIAGVNAKLGDMLIDCMGTSEEIPR